MIFNCKASKNYQVTTEDSESFVVRVTFSRPVLFLPHVTFWKTFH